MLVLLVLATLILAPDTPPTTVARGAVLEVVGSPVDALVEVRSPESDAWLVRGLTPARVGIERVTRGLYTVRVSAGGYARQTAVVDVQSGTATRLEFHLRTDDRSPVFWGTWLAYVRDGGVYAVEMGLPLSQREERTLVPPGRARSTVWLDDGRVVYGLDDRRSLVAVDIDARREERVPVADASFELRWALPDGRVLGTVDTPNGIQPAVVDLRTGALTRVGGPGQEIGDAAPSPDGRTLAGGPPGGVTVFDMEGRELSQATSSHGSRGWCERAFLPDGLRLLTTAWEPQSGGRIEAIDLRGRVLWQGRRGLYDVRPAADGVHYAAVRFADDGEREIVVGALGSEQVISVAKGARPYWSPQPKRHGD